MKIEFTEEELDLMKSIKAWLIPLLQKDRTQVLKLIYVLGGHKGTEKHLKIFESLLDKFEG